jgi:hypothetical protein
MKKFILMMFLFLITIKVNALEYGVWTDEYVEDENTKITATETRYKWSKTDIINSDEYYVEGENNSEYPFILSNDYIYSDWSEWDEKHPEIKPNRNVEHKLVNRYRTLKKVRYLFLENFQGGYISFKIAELNVLINNTETDVYMQCNDCSFGFNTAVKDNLLVDDAYIKNGGSLMIDLGSYYLISDIKLELYMYDYMPYTKKFNLYYNSGPTLDDGNIGYKEIDIYTVSDDINKPEKHLIAADSTFISNYIYDDWIYIDGLSNASYCKQAQTLIIYRYKDKKYRYYKEALTYTDYYSNYDDQAYKKDETTAKTFYLYEYVSSPETTNDDNQSNSVVPDADNNQQEVITNNPIFSEENNDSSSDQEVLDIDDNYQEIVSNNHFSNTTASDANNTEQSKIDITPVTLEKEHDSNDKIASTGNSTLKINKTLADKKTSPGKYVFLWIIYVILLCLILILVIYTIRNRKLSYQN